LRLVKGSVADRQLTHSGGILFSAGYGYPFRIGSRKSFLMSAANRQAGAHPYAEVAMRISLGVGIVVAHAVVIYTLRESFPVPHGLESSTSFVTRIIDVSQPALLLNAPPPAISKVDLRLAMPVIPTAEIDTSLSSENPRFEQAKLDPSRPAPQFVATVNGHRGVPLTITLLVEVLADGSVGQVEVKASAGADLDAAAESYVRKLPWMPANVGGKPIAMKVLYSLAP
jgi:hypothetical protein